MATQEKEAAAPPSPNGKPLNKPVNPVIRRDPLAETEEEGRWKRQMPAWVISGGIHVVLIALVVLFYPHGSTKAANTDQIIEAKVDDEKKEENLVNPDEGLDPDKAFNIEAERVEQVVVDTPNESPDDPIGIQSADPGPPINVEATAGFGGGETGSPADPSPDGAATKKADEYGGAGGRNPGLGFRGNARARKDLIDREGGNSESEAAVARGLIWLARMQRPDGSWITDGSTKDPIAGTGLGLLPFLAAGQTHRISCKYQKTVLGGVTYLLGKQKPDGTFTGSNSMYAMAIATMALCEAYGMSQDPKIQPRAQAALNYLVKAQHSGGGWRYRPNEAGDTSVSGWVFQALKSGMMARLAVPNETIYRYVKFLDSVQSDEGARYGYTGPGGSIAMTAVGLLCREYLGWGPKKKALGDGVDFLLKHHPPRENEWDIYYYYYATQVVHFFGGDEWKIHWNPKMRDMLIKLQNKSPAPALHGSWDPDRHHTGSAGGRLCTTCLALLTLEVYYRHLPLYRRDDAGLRELEAGN